MARSLLLISVVLVLSCSIKQNETTAPVLKAGASAAHINPPIGSFIAGDTQNRKFEFLHDSLFAKSIVIDDGASMIAMVTLDCIGLLYPDVQRIRHEASALTGIPEERIIVSSTHTHSGPDVVGIWGENLQHSGVDPTYMQFLVSTAAQQVKTAFDRRVPVAVLAAETTFGEGWVVNICDEEIDRGVSTLQFVTDTGNSIASVTNFACHPTFLDAKFSAISSDYVAGFYRSMNARYGGEHLFLQGAIGGWVQPVDGEGSFEKAYTRGSQLASTVNQALQQADTLEQTDIKFNFLRMKLPVDNDAWQQLAETGTIKRDISDSVETEMAWFSIGDAQFATHPGETTPYLGLFTKRLMTTGPRFVMGLTLDAMGYIIKPEYFDDETLPHAEYLTRMSLGRETSPILEAKLVDLIPQDNKQGL